MKILLADDHTLFREGMHYVLSKLGEQVSIIDADSFPIALDMAWKNPDLDLALLDLQMPGSDGAISIKLFHARYPDVPIVVISGTDERNDIIGAMSNGAMGFISKASSSKDMVLALRMVLDGGTYLPPQMLQAVSAENELGDGRSWRTNKVGLTARQMEVLQHLGQGLPNKDIAEAIKLAEGTVKIHIAGIFHALRVNNRIEAVRVARNMGLLADAEPT